MKERIKNHFLSGLVFAVPIVVTVYITIFIVNTLGGIWQTIFAGIPYIREFPPLLIKFIGLIISFIIILFIGFLGSNILGRFLFSIPTKILKNTPIMKDIYKPAKELTDTLFMNKANFKTAVLVEFFRKGEWTVAFITSDAKWNIDDEEAVSIFVPTSPNPTNGFFAIIPRSQTRKTDLTVEEALKLIVSSGLVFSKTGEIFSDEYKRNSQ